MPNGRTMEMEGYLEIISAIQTPYLSGDKDMLGEEKNLLFVNKKKQKNFNNLI